VSPPSLDTSFTRKQEHLGFSLGVMKYNGGHGHKKERTKKKGGWRDQELGSSHPSFRSINGPNFGGKKGKPALSDRGRNLFDIRKPWVTVLFSG